MTDIAVTLTVCNLIGLILAVLLAWASRHSYTTPDGRARVLSAVTVGAFAFTGLARRIDHPAIEQITLGTWIVVITATAWKLADQRKRNRDTNPHPTKEK